MPNFLVVGFIANVFIMSVYRQAANPIVNSKVDICIKKTSIYHARRIPIVNSELDNAARRPYNLPH